METAMNAKKLVLVVVIVFVGFWMFTDPNGLAEAARSGGAKIWDLTVQLFQAVISFIDALA
jgi:hypothetical protein